MATESEDPRLKDFTALFPVETYLASRQENLDVTGVNGHKEALFPGDKVNEGGTTEAETFRPLTDERSFIFERRP
ncbi:hypothetical protein J7E71_02520 [Mesobacillus foraminis]|uniref:hypothetical protein n=1 Tax=Mesobacillus foraminis TaxID=279826 RepID=UPI001BEAD126|nr:hypothetical protein [Mesobacillus foraminis]MBT2754822.1 hypothetical protein [Mesobacillus foraminis]